MQESVLNVLALVGRRQRAAFALRSMAYGLLAGSLLGVAFGVVRWRWGVALPLWLIASSGPLVALLAVLLELLRRGGLHDAAAAVDRHYQFKDRSATALEFLGKASPTPLQSLQIADAAQHLQRVDPRDVAPLKRPRSLWYALGSWALAVGVAVLLWLVPFGEPAVEAGPAPTPPQILAVIERLEERLQDLDEEARKEQDKELEKLVEFRRQKIEEMKQANLDQREALIKLSEMEAATQALHAQYNTALAEGQLASAGSAMCAAPALEGAGRALQENKLDKGAEELEKLEEPTLTPKEQKVVEEKLKQVAKEMGEAGLGQLSGAVSDFAESLKGGKGKGKKATKVLAREVKNVARRKRINNLLTGELDDLKECKCNCNSLITGKKPQKSTSPSSNFGAATSGNVQGERTNLLGQRNQVDLTGTPGEGPSDVETTASPEARQQARRNYKEVYKKYRKESDAVLDSEAIPLGHRQTIRRYFELIRPQSGDMPEKKPAGQE